MTPEIRRLIKDIELLRAVVTELVPVLDFADAHTEQVDTQRMRYLDMVRDHIKEAMEVTVPDVIPEVLDNRGEFV